MSLQTNLYEITTTIFIYIFQNQYLSYKNNYFVLDTCEKRYFWIYRQHLQRSERSNVRKIFMEVEYNVFQRIKDNATEMHTHLHTLMKWLSTLLFEFWKSMIYGNKSCAWEHDAKSAASISMIWFGGNVDHCYCCGTLYFSARHHHHRPWRHGALEWPECCNGLMGKCGWVLR